MITDGSLELSSIGEIPVGFTTNEGYLLQASVKISDIAPDGVEVFTYKSSNPFFADFERPIQTDPNFDSSGFSHILRHTIITH